MFVCGTWHGSPVAVPASKEVLRTVHAQIAHRIRYGTDEERKSLVQALVREIRVDSREHITPVLRVPTTTESLGGPKVRAMGGLVDLTRAYSNRLYLRKRVWEAVEIVNTYAS